MEIVRHKYNTPNVGQAERAASVIIGSLMVWKGLSQLSRRRNKWAGAGTAFFGLGFLRRGITGFCYTYQALGVSTASKAKNVSIPYELGIRVDEAITINRPVEAVYRFWRNLENIAEFMEHVESVRPTGDNRSHWVAKGPGNRRMEWDAEIINEVEISSSDGVRSKAQMCRMRVRFVLPRRRVAAVRKCGSNCSTILPANLGAYVAKLFGEEPSVQIRNDLKRLKTRLEAGVVPTTEGQPVGSSSKTEQDSDHERRAEKVASASEESFPASDAPAYTH